MASEWQQTLNASINAALCTLTEFDRDLSDYERAEQESFDRPMLVHRAVVEDWQPYAPEEWKKSDGSLLPYIQSMVSAYVERRYGVDPYDGMEQAFDDDDMPVVTLTDDEEEDLKSRHL